MRIFFIVIIGLIIGVLFLTIFYGKKKELSQENRKYFLGIFLKIKSNTSYKTKIIDYDKLYHNILKNVGYKGTFGEILKSNPKIIKNIDKIWELHKLRNKLVHEFDEYKSLNLKVLEYEKEIKRLFNDIK